MRLYLEYCFWIWASQYTDLLEQVHQRLTKYVGTGIHVVRGKTEETGSFNLGKRSLRGRGWSVLVLSSAATVRILQQVNRRTKGNGHSVQKGELIRYVGAFLPLEEVSTATGI